MSVIGHKQRSGTRLGRKTPRDLPAVRVIPYDYVAEFRLTGRVGNLVQSVINISVEGVFVASSIGYGMDDQRTEAFQVAARDDGSTPKLDEMTLGDIPPDLLIEGFRINPQFRSVAIRNDALDPNLPFQVAQGVFERIKVNPDFGFLLSIVDTASGRELQNEPVHSVASMGGPNGKRPFKMLPQPMVFMPRSTVRLQVEERSQGVEGRLYVTLQGYKVLGVSGELEKSVRRIGDFDALREIPVYDYESGNYARLGETLIDDIPSTKIVPFDYVSTLNLKGEPGLKVEDEVPVNIDGGYLSTAISYSLDVCDTTVKIENLPDGQPVDLASISLRDIRPVQALLDGIRIHPIRLRFAFTCDGRLSSIPHDMAQRMFQRVNRLEEVRFRYSFTDSATGRELQNQPVYNVAGLGVADGDRPFRILHKPMVFLPRSTIRVQVEEIFGRGRLFIVFQGYKILR